jgi:hypothetical protein
MTSLSFCLRETSFGPVAIVWSLFHARPMIRRVILSKPGSPAGLLVAARFPDCSSSSCPEIDTVADWVAAFLAGDDIHFSLNTIRNETDITRNGRRSL